MQFPLWAGFGLISATLSTGVMLTQERFKLPGFVMAYWVKVFSALFALPFVIWLGVPSDPAFYVLLSLQAVLWVINDVIFFNTITRTGAGVVSRILPLSVIVTFFAWFIVDPSTLQKYLATPYLSAGVVAALGASVYFVLRLKKCAISWAAIKMLWFVLFSAVAGPIVQKILLGHASVKDGPFAFVFFEALAMLLMWPVYYALRRPVAWREMVSLRAARGGGCVAAFSFLMVASNVVALIYVDNPGLLPAVKFVDSFMILLIYKMTGRKEQNDVLSGVGIVLCAAVIVIFKSF